MGNSSKNRREKKKELLDQSVLAAKYREAGYECIILTFQDQRRNWLAESQPPTSHTPDRGPQLPRALSFLFKTTACPISTTETPGTGHPDQLTLVAWQERNFPQRLVTYASAAYRALTFCYPYLGLDHRLAPKKLSLTSRNLSRSKQSLLCLKFSPMFAINFPRAMLINTSLQCRVPQKRTSLYLSKVRPSSSICHSAQSLGYKARCKP